MVPGARQYSDVISCIPASIMALFWNQTDTGEGPTLQLLFSFCCYCCYHCFLPFSLPGIPPPLTAGASSPPAPPKIRLCLTRQKSCTGSGHCGVGLVTVQQSQANTCLSLGEALLAQEGRPTMSYTCTLVNHIIHFSTPILLSAPGL